MYAEAVAGAHRVGVSRVALLFRRQDAHSLYLTCAALLLSLTLVIDLIFHRHMTNRWLLWTLLVICLSGSAAAFMLGSRVPRWIGLTAVGVFVSSQTYFLSLQDDPQSVVSSVQQLPVVAFYLGWFVRPGVATWLIAVCSLAFGAAMLSNPLFWPDGDIGVPVAVHGLLSLLFCFFAGTYLWLRTTRKARLDPLTTAVNRAGLIEHLDSELRRRSSRGACALVAIDFDNFKRLNDDLGHAAGDAALTGAVREWREGIRVQDIVARIGGDEFVILFPGTTAAAAEAVMDRLQLAAAHAWSYGIAESTEADTVTTLLARADTALFEQKRCKRGHLHG